MSAWLVLCLIFFSIQEIGREERHRNDVFVLSGDETLLKLKLNASEL